MKKQEFKQLILDLNKSESHQMDNLPVVPNGIIEILVNNFDTWDDLDGLTYDEMVKISNETGEFPGIDNLINFYGDMDTIELSLNAVLEALFDLAEDFSISLESAANAHRIIYIEIDKMFVLLY